MWKLSTSAGSVKVEEAHRALIVPWQGDRGKGDGVGARCAIETGLTAAQYQAARIVPASFSVLKRAEPAGVTSCAHRGSR